MVEVTLGTTCIRSCLGRTIQIEVLQIIKKFLLWKTVIQPYSAYWVTRVTLQIMLFVRATRGHGGRYRLLSWNQENARLRVNFARQERRTSNARGTRGYHVIRECYKTSYKNILQNLWNVDNTIIIWPIKEVSCTYINTNK